MMVSVIVPLSREWCALRVAENFRRQRHPEKRLIVIENGGAVGACKRYGISPHITLVSDNHLSVAKNAGVDWVRKNGGGFWTTFDDDDYYGADYLSRCALHARHGRVVGAPRHFVQLADGLHLFNRDTLAGEFGGDCFHGATLGAWAEESVRFPVVNLGEEAGFCSAMRAAGARLWSVGAGEYVYHRHGSHHVWRATDIQVRRATGDSWLDGKLMPKPSNQEVFADSLRIMH